MRNPTNICYYCMGELNAPGEKCPHCGFDNRRRSNETSFLPAMVINNQYYVGRALGRGGFGVTYLGYDLNLQRKVAIKEYFPRELAKREANSVTLTPFTDSRKSFQYGMKRALDEGVIIANMGHIPNVVQVYNAIQANGTVYIIMEYIDGMTLTGMVRRQGRLEWRRAYELLKPIMRALQRVHAKGIIHRDVSPDNIMLNGETNETVLLDFGAAHAYVDVQEGHTRSLRPGFAPPEQYSTKSLQDARTDEYALCATMYYLITGSIPVGADSIAFAGEKLATPREQGVDIPEQVEAVLLKGMSVNINDRYASIEKLGEAFETAVTSINQPASQRKSGEKKKRSRDTSLLVGLVVAIVTLIAVLAAVLYSVIAPPPGPEPSPSSAQEEAEESPSEEEVREWQEKLIALGLLPAGSVNGDFDLATQAAVKRFQSRVNELQGEELVPVDGVADGLTLTWLDYYCDEEQRGTPMFAKHDQSGTTAGPQEKHQVSCSLFIKPMADGVVPSGNLMFYGTVPANESFTLSIGGRSFQICHEDHSLDGEAADKVFEWQQVVDLSKIDFPVGIPTTVTLSPDSENCEGGASITITYKDKVQQPAICSPLVSGNSALWGYVELGAAGVEDCILIDVIHADGSTTAVPIEIVAVDSTSGYFYARLNSALQPGDAVQIKMTDFCGNTSTNVYSLNGQLGGSAAEMLGASVLNDSESDTTDHRFVTPIDLSQLANGGTMELPVVAYKGIEIARVTAALNESGALELSYRITAPSFVPAGAQARIATFATKPGFDELAGGVSNVAVEDLSAAPEGSLGAINVSGNSGVVWLRAEFDFAMDEASYIARGGRGVNFYRWLPESKQTESLLGGAYADMGVHDDNERFYGFYFEFANM